jgi:hypothetical protein
MTPENAASGIVQPAELTPENAALAFEGTDVLASWVDRVGRRARKPECAGLRFAFTGGCRRRTAGPKSGIDTAAGF